MALFFSVAGLALGWMLWLTTRSERERDPVLHAWHRLDARYRRLGLGRQAHEPALVWAQRVAAQRPQAGDLKALSARFDDWRYAHRQDGVREARDHARCLIRDLRAHRP